ncbi:MAG: OmpA family protein, partial [Cytophagaceae bacterium]
MKRLFTPLFFAIALILFGACRSFEGGNVAVRPAIMEVHGDSVYYNAHVSVPERSGIRTRTEYRISPVLAAHRFDTMEVYSDECVDLNEVGVDSNFRYSARFDESMMGNYLNAEHWYKRKGRKRTFPQMEKLAYCCVRSGDLLSSDDKYLISESYYGGDPTPIKLVGQFNFPRGVYEFDISTLSEKDINTVMTFLHMKASPATLEISAYASPEGDMAYNKMLSKNRAREVKNWVQEETNKLPAGTMKGKTIKTNAYGEDWTGFRQKIKDSDLSSDKKNKIIKIIDSNKHPEQKEKEIRTLAGDLNTLEPYLAPLRRTNIVIAGQ